MMNTKELGLTSRRTFLGATAAGLLATQARESPQSGRFPWRVIELWHTPDNSVTWWTRNGNILTWADMLHTQPASPLGRYITQLGRWGFNAMNLSDRVNPDQNLEAVRNFARYLKDHGIRLVLSRGWSSARRAGGEVAKLPDGEGGFSEKLCPYQPAVHEYWRARVSRDFQILPEIAAYHMGGGRDDGPWACNCAECQKRTPRERTLDAIQLISTLLEKHGATLIWSAVQDDPWHMRVETDLYSDLAGKVPPNVLVRAVGNYWDFHPGWPIHSVLDGARKDAQGKSPYITTIQEPGEYRGMHEFPWPMVDEWSETFRNMANTGQQGAWVVTEVLPDGWDHPLNMVNWHAIETYMRDPFADPAKIKLEWAEQRFGAQAGQAMPEILDKIRESARGMYEFDALGNHKHSRFPWLEYLDCHYCGPYRQLKRVKGMMGMNLPLDMYPPSRAAEIKANPKTRMVFNSVPITRQLRAEAMAQKDNAVQLIEQAIKQWGDLKGAIPAEEHAKIAAGLQANRADTIVFRGLMDLFMDWKLGVLTSSKIDAVLAASHGLRGAIVPEPLLVTSPETTSGGPGDGWTPGAVRTQAGSSAPQDRTPATLASVAGQLRRDLRTPWVEEFWKSHPTGVL